MKVRFFVGLFTMASLLGLSAVRGLADEGDDNQPQRGNRPAQGERRGGGNPNELFSKLDANSDGKVTAEEVGEDQKRLFDRIVSLGDKDKDGQLTKEEFAAGLRPQQGGDRPAFRPGGDRPQIDPEQAFSRMDSNGDGKIELSELPEQRREFFERMMQFGDRNGDKALDLAEFKAIQNRGSATTATPQRGMDGRFGAGFAVFAALDTNRDGSLSSEEVAAATSVLKKLDKNGDGKIEGEELRPAGPTGQVGQGGSDRFLADIDKDKDGKISKDEAPERLKENFDRVDTNGDGFIDAAERRAMFARFQQRGEGRPENNKRPERKPSDN